MCSSENQIDKQKNFCVFFGKWFRLLQISSSIILPMLNKREIGL